MVVDAPEEMATKQQALNFFVTGLCMQGNRGGPALALSLIGQLHRHFPGATFCFSVPLGRFFKDEERWAKIYGVHVVETFAIKDILPPYCIFRWPASFRRFKLWWKAAKSADAIIEMSAISYVGPPRRPDLSSIIQGRFLYFVSAMFARKPFLAWTQSLGPFSGRLTRIAAKFDLARQPIVFCRGDNAASNVKKLLPDAQARSFPDVAVCLKYDLERGQRLISGVLGTDSARQIVTLSPSAVIYRELAGQHPNPHAVQLAKLCDWLVTRGYRVLMVPHTVYSGEHAPEYDDYGVCLEVREYLKDTNSVGILEGDFSPADLKSVFAAGDYHIGGRYHGIVGALSAHVPCISLAWHSKYRDIMQIYGISEFVHDALTDTAIEPLTELFVRLEGQRQGIQVQLTKQHQLATAAVEENADLFAAHLRAMLR